MFLRKSTLSQYSALLLAPNSPLDINSASSQRESNISQQNEFSSPASLLDSLDNLIDNKSQKKSRFFFSNQIEPTRSQKKIKTEIIEEKKVEMNAEVQPFRIRLRERKPKINLTNNQNDCEDFFSSAELPKQKKDNYTKKEYKLVTFTDFVENIYGKDWFEKQPQRRLKRQITIQEFFDSPC